MKIQVSFNEDKPTLYIVSTPIGNLKDMTLRAIEVLKSVDVILCEDTRVTGKLLKVYDIKTPLRSYQKFNERASIELVIKDLEKGLSLALVSDAGTPLLSDPGYILVEALKEKDFNVVPIPGASAILSALVVSGIAPQPFTFVGFLPRKAGEMKSVLKMYETRIETLVIYESPLRVEKTLQLILECLGNRKVTLARELTKKFETIYTGTLESVLDETLNTRGEYVIVLAGAKPVKTVTKDPVELVEHYIKLGYEEKEAIKLASKDLGVHKSEVYKVYKVK